MFLGPKLSNRNNSIVSDFFILQRSYNFVDIVQSLNGIVC